MIFPTRRFDDTARVEYFSRVSGSPGGFALDTSVWRGECYLECLDSDTCGTATALKCSWVSVPYISYDILC